MLEIQNLTKVYGNFTALDHVNVTLDRGVYGLLGHNGAGKSTLLNLISDNLKRTDGEILYNGREILEMGAQYRKNIGYTPQTHGMYENFTAREFLHYIGALKGMKAKEIKAQTEEFLTRVNLDREAHHRLGSFSGGMKQRTLIAAAMLDRPDILILDEPTVGLDPEERIHLCDYIAGIGTDRTVILATHVVSDIENIADKVMLLKNGRLCRFAAPQELVAQIREVPEEKLPAIIRHRGTDLTLEDMYLYIGAGAGEDNV